MNLSYPLAIDHNGLLHAASPEEHIEQLMEQVLFTLPGERVNRPDFGIGLANVVFSAATAEVISAMQLLIQAALQQWLGYLIQVRTVQVTGDGDTLTLLISYQIKSTQQQKIAQFTSQKQVPA